MAPAMTAAGIPFTVSDFLAPGTCFAIDDAAFRPWTMAMPLLSPPEISPPPMWIRAVRDFAPVPMPTSLAVASSLDFYDPPREKPKNEWKFVYLFPLGKRAHMRVATHGR